MSKQIVKVICEIKVPFDDFGKASFNRQAAAAIKREIMSILNERCRYINIEDLQGRWDSECSDTTTIKVRGDLI